jgi:hypothetical protein
LFGSRLRPTLTALALCFVLSFGIAGCAAPKAEFIDAKASYTEASAKALADRIDASKLANTATDQAAALRHEALTELRSRGGRAVLVADMLTKTFSAQTRGVPIYFERATFNGTPAVVVVEATGPPAGKLTTKRVWILDENGGVLFMGAK